MYLYFRMSAVCTDIKHYLLSVKWEYESIYFDFEVPKKLLIKLNKNPYKSFKIPNGISHAMFNATFSWVFFDTYKHQVFIINFKGPIKGLAQKSILLFFLNCNTKDVGK